MEDFFFFFFRELGDEEEETSRGKRVRESSAEWGEKDENVVFLQELFGVFNVRDKNGHKAIN